MDANIQYLDFFSYFKDVLNGENDLSYSFSKTLGGTGVGIFSYYLASPLNLLVVFFEKSEMHTFLDLLVLLKCGLAAVTMYLFLQERFLGGRSEQIRETLVWLLSVCYALSQYSVAQSSNIMWLEGVYLLPLMLLGVYRVVYDGSGLLLTFSTACSILFNWYTGGINCLFSAIWFVVELFQRWLVQGETKPVQSMIRRAFWYGSSILLGLCLSAGLFFPTIAALRKSGRGTLELGWLKDLSFNGQIASVIEAYSLGAKSSYGRVSLFCGSIVLIGCLCIFCKKEIAVRIKIFFATLLTGTLLLFYWNPLYVVFSLFKGVWSYWYRYSYVGIFALIFTAAYFYLQYAEADDWLLLVKSGAFGGGMLLLAHYAHAEESTTRVQYTALLMAAAGGLCAIAFYCAHAGRKRQRIAVLGLAALVLTECTLSTVLQAKNYHASDVEMFRQYALSVQPQLQALEQLDDGVYRITQTSTRNMEENNLTAYYNDALAYRFWSISGYTSSPDDVQRTFLDRLGYRISGDNMCIVNTSILGADSLLGVKYMLSAYPIRGWEKLDAVEPANGKAVYENPFALPLAFTYRAGENTLRGGENPFEYQNKLYSQLLGQETALFTPVAFTCETREDGTRVYLLDVPQGNYSLYGNLPWNSEFSATVNVNDVYQTSYARWLSPSVFYIPSAEDSKTAWVTVESEQEIDLQEGGEQFYALDLDCFAAAAQRLQANTVDQLELSNGHVMVHVNAEEGEQLYLSVPYDSGWEISVNGIKTEPELFADCMYTFELTAGENVIEMEYKVEYLALGLITSLLGVLGTAAMTVMYRKQKKGGCGKCCCR